MDIVKSINTSVDAVLDEFDCAYFAVTLKVEFKTKQSKRDYRKTVILNFENDWWTFS
uniref:Non-structural protein 3a n=1 Tax=Transmissible gastroenteritis virus TaxID=11149 RepID=A0A384V9M1_TGEV|nr:truncated non-structural protein 3a [Transmissible gastroenteritis virus]